MVGESFSGGFSTPGYSGSVSETMGTKRGHCYKGTCGVVTYISSGNGFYNEN
jgi:hypothetical protein